MHVQSEDTHLNTFTRLTTSAIAAILVFSLVPLSAAAESTQLCPYQVVALLCRCAPNYPENIAFDTFVAQPDNTDPSKQCQSSSLFSMRSDAIKAKLAELKKQIRCARSSS